MSSGRGTGCQSKIERLLQRQLGGTPTGTRGHQPASFVNSFTSDPSLLKRLTETAELDGHNGYVNAVQWNASGTKLVSGSDDCKIRIWDPNCKLALHSFDSGHTANILDVKFLPDTGDEQLVSCSGDWQVRHVNLHKSAVRPYVCHQGRVRSLVTLDRFTFLSGSEDGTVRQFDTRERPPQPCNRQRTLSQTDNHNVVVDQNERLNGKLKQKVGVNSVAVDPMMPVYLITGGGDAAVRLYDRRFLPTRPSHSRRSGPKWVSCFFPTHLKGGIRQQQLPYTLQTRHSQVTGVAFTYTGREIVASYSCEQIYSFNVTRHGRDPEALLMNEVVESRSERSAYPRSGSRFQQRPPSGARSRTPTERRTTNITAAAQAPQAAVSLMESTLRMDLPEALEVVQAASEDPLRRAAGLRQGSHHQLQRPPTGTPLPSPSRQSSGGQFQPRGAAAAGPSRNPDGPAGSSIPHTNQRDTSPAPASVQLSRHNRSEAAVNHERQQRPVQAVLQAQLTLIGARLQLYSASAARSTDGHGPTATTATATNSTDHRRFGPSDDPLEIRQTFPGTPAAATTDRRSVEATAHTHTHGMQRTVSSDEEDNGVDGEATEASAARAPKRHRDGNAAAGPSTAAQESPRVSKRLRRGRAANRQPPTTAGAGPSDPSPQFPVPPRLSEAMQQAAPQPEVSAGQSHASWHTGEPIRRQVSITSPSRPARSSPSTSDAAIPCAAPHSSTHSQQPPVSQLGNHHHRPPSTLAAAGRTLAIASGLQDHHPAASTGTSNRRRSRRGAREGLNVVHLHCAGPSGRSNEQDAAASGRVQTRPRSARTRPRTRLLEASFLLAAEDLTVDEDDQMEVANEVSFYAAPPHLPSLAAAEHQEAHEVVDFDLHADGAAGPNASAVSQHGRADHVDPFDDAAAMGVSWNEVQDLFGRSGVVSQDEHAGSVEGDQEYSLLGHSGRDPSVVEGNAGPREQAGSVEGVAVDIMGGPYVRHNVPQNSHIGAIVLDTDDVSGEEVEESGMFLSSYSGHRNIMSSKPVSLLGAHSEYVLSGSDDGHLFIWEYATGQLLNMLGTDDSFVVHSVQPHPCDPVLATCGQDNIVRIWSPEAESACDLQHAETVVQRNVNQVAEAAQFHGINRPPWINIAGLGGPPIFIDGRGPTGRGGNPVRCNIM